MLQSTCQFNLGLGYWQRNVNQLQKKIVYRKILRRAEKQLRQKISKRRTRRCMNQLKINPVVYVEKLDGLFFYNYLKRRSSNTKSDESTRTHSDNDENSNNGSENINDLENVKLYPELIADAVGSPVKKSVPFSKTSIKLKYSYSKYKNIKTKIDESQNSSDDEADDDSASLSDSISLSRQEGRISMKLHLHEKSDVPKKKNIVTENDCTSDNIYVQTSNSEDSSDMETTRVGSSKHHRISRIPNSSINTRKNETFSREETLQRTQGFFRRKELKAQRRAEKRKNECAYGATSLKIKKQFSQYQKSMNSIHISDEEDTRDSSSKKHLSKKSENYTSESSSRSSIERDLKKARHISSPYPDKRRRTEKNSTQKKNIDREKICDRPVLSSDDSSLRRNRSHTESTDKSKTQSKEIEKRQKFDDVKELEKSKRLEDKKQKNIRSSIDSGIGRVTPTQEALDNTESEKRSKSSKHSRHSEHSSSRSNFDKENVESLERRRMKIQKELNEMPNSETNNNIPLSLPFINDSDGCKTDDDLTCDNHAKDCIDPKNKSHIHDNVFLENSQEILSKEVTSNKNEIIRDDSTSIREEVNKLLSNYSSSDENDDHINSEANRNFVDNSDVTAESIGTNLIENKTNIKSSSDDNVRHEENLAKSKDNESMIDKKNCDTKDFLNNQELSESSQNCPSNQNSNIKLNQVDSALEFFRKYLEKRTQENPALNIQQLILNLLKNDEKGEQCNPITPPLIQKNPTEILNKNSEKNSNVAESMKAFEFDDKTPNPEKFEVQNPVFMLNVLVDVHQVENSKITTSTPSTSTVTVTSSAKSPNFSTIHPTAAVPTTSLITAGSQSGSHFAMSNKSCSLTTLASQISTPTLSTATPTTQQLPPYRNPSPETLPTPTTSQLHPYQDPSTSLSSTSIIRKPPPPYSSLFPNEHCLQQNNSSGKKSDCQENKSNIHPKQEIPISESEDCRQLMHETIESILQIRKFFNEFKSIIQDPNYNPFNFTSHPLFISVRKIFQSMMNLQKLLKCDWESLFTKLISYSQSLEDNTKQINLHDLGTTVQMYCCGNDVPTKLSSIYPQKEKTVATTSGDLNNQNTAVGTIQSSSPSTTTESQGNMCAVFGCKFPNCPEEPVTNSHSSSTINYNLQSHSLPEGSTLQQPNTTEVTPAFTTSMSMDQNQQNSLQNTVLLELLTSHGNNQNYSQFQASVNQPSNNIPTQAPVLSSDIHYNQFQQRNIFPSPISSSKVNNDEQLYNLPRSSINQQFNNQADSLTSQQSNVMTTPVELPNMNNQQHYNQQHYNQQFYNQSKTFKSQPTNVGLTSKLSHSANNNQQFYYQQLYNQQLYNQQLYNRQLYNQQLYNQSRFSVSEQSNIVSNPVPSSNINNNRQYKYHSRNLIVLQPNVVSTPASAFQTNNNQQYNNQMSISTYQQPYTVSTPVPPTNINNNQQFHNQSIYDPQIYSQSTSMYQQQNKAQTLALHPNANPTNGQQYNNEVSASMSQQSYISSTSRSFQSNYNQINTLNSQKRNMVPISGSNSNVNNRQQCNNEANISLSQKQNIASTPRSSSNNNQQYKNQVNASIPQQSNFVPPMISFSLTNNNQRHNNQPEAVTSQQQKISTVNHNQQNYNQSDVLAQQLKNVPTSMKVKQSKKKIIGIVRDKRSSDTIRAQMKQPSINPQAAVHTSVLRQVTHNTANQAQVQATINPPTSVPSNVSQPINSREVIQALVQQSSINPQAAVHTSVLRQVTHNTTNQAQVQATINPPTSVPSNVSQPINSREVIQALVQQSSINPQTSVQSGIMQQVNYNTTNRAQVQATINPPTSVPSDVSQPINSREAIQAQQSSTNLPTSVQSGVLQKSNHCSTASRTQVHQSFINPLIAIPSDLLKKLNHINGLQIQAQQPSTNPPTATQSGVSQKVNYNTTTNQVQVQQISINTPTSLPSGISQQVNDSTVSQAPAQLNSNPSTSVQSSILPQANRSEVSQSQAQKSSNSPALSMQFSVMAKANQTQVQQSLINPPNSVQSSVLQQANVNTVSQAPPQLSSNSSILIRSDLLQQTDRSETIQVQAQQSSTNPPTSVQSNELRQDSHNETTIKEISTIVTSSNEPDRTNNSIMVSQALESLALLPMNCKDAKKRQSSKKQTQKSKTILPQNIPKVTENKKVCSKEDTQDSSTHTSIENNEIDNDKVEEIEIKQDSDENDNSISSQQVPIQNENQNDLIIVEVKKESTFTKRNNQSNHVEDLHDINFDLGFLDDTEYIKDSQKSIKEIKSNTNKNASTNQAISVKTEESYNKVSSKLKNHSHTTMGSLINNDFIRLDDNENDDNQNDLDKVSVISSDRETVRMDQSEDDILIDEEHIITDTYIYTKQCIGEEIDCAMTGENSAFSSDLKIENVTSITSDDFNNLKEAGEQSNKSQANDVPENIDVKLEIDEEEYYVIT